MANTGSPASFTSLVASLATTGVAAMQEVEKALSDTGSPQAAPTAPQGALTTVQHLVDLLAMLEQKTSGNLDASEKRTLQAALTELRIGYVKLADKVKATGGRPE